MEINLILPGGVPLTLPIKSFDTAKDLITNCLKDYPNEDKTKFQLIETKKGRDGVIIERPVKDAAVISQLKNEWQADKEHVYSLILMRLDNEVVVNFNNYFRMMAGVSQTRATFPISESSTIGELIEKIKGQLKLPAQEQRFGLMGFYGANKDTRKLHRDEKVLGLKNAWETPDNTFFQFQVLPEMEDKKHLGADKEGYLELYYTFPPLWKKRWASLRGNCLFLFKEKGETAPTDRIDRLNDLRVVAVGTAKKKGLGQKFAFRFEIEGGDDTKVLAAEDDRTMSSWVEAIKSCGTRNDARAALVASKAPTPQRTFVPIANPTGTAPGTAAILQQISESEQQDKMLENLKKAGEALMAARGSAMVATTKALVTESQNFSIAISKKLDDKTPKAKKERIEENINKVKTTLKAIIPAAKGVGTCTGDIESSSELKTLKKEVTSLLDACEFILITLRMEEDEILFQEATQEDFKMTATGNSELDSIVSGLNMFGISPELAEMMKMASTMSSDGDPLAAFAPAPTYSATPAKKGVPAADDPLDSILAGLNNALDGLDVPLPQASSHNEPNFNWEASQSEERCALCFGTIHGKVVKGLNRTWHPECYYCTQCMCDLANKNSEEVFEGPKSMPYCKKDFLTLCPKCHTCTQPVLPKDAFHAFDKIFHNRCFKCAMCSNSIDGPGFELENKPYCENCFHQSQGTLCVECYKGIYGSSVTVLGKKRHPHCFICSYCKKTLTKETAKAKDEKLYCSSCMAQLHG